MAFFERSGRCTAFLVFVSLLYFAPLWSHPKELLYSEHSDILSVHYPWRVFAVKSVQATHALPLWCPYACSGQPFQADLQTNLFYPPNLLFYFVPVSWVAPFFGVLIFTHVLIAGLGMFAYARSRGLERFPALVAAVGFMFAGKWLLHVLQAGHYIFVPLAWFPLLLLCLQNAVEQRRLVYAVAAGVLGAIILTGSHPQLVLFCAYLACLLSLPSIVQRRNPPEQAATDGTLRRPIVSGLAWWLTTWVVAGLVATGLAAAQWLPSLELASMTTRVQTITADFSQSYDLTFHNLPELVKRLLSLAGPQNFGGNPWESVGAFGVLWTGVAVLVIGLCRRPIVWFYGGVLVLLVLCAFNTSTPVYPCLRRLLPGLALLRHPTRMLLFAGFPLGMLAGHLTQQVFGTKALSKKTLLSASGFLFVLSVVYLVMSWRAGGVSPLMFEAIRGLTPPARQVWYWGFVIVLGPAFASLLVWRSLWPTRTTWLGVAWLMVLMADLWALHWHFVRTRPVDQIYPVNDAVRFLAEQPGRYRVLDRIAPGQPAAFSPLSQPLCYLQQIEWLRGLNPTDLYSYKQFLNFVAGRAGPPELGEMPLIQSVRNQQLLDLLGVRYLLCPADLPLAADEKPYWRLVQNLTDNPVHLEDDRVAGGVFRLPPFVVYERKAPLPRAFVVSRAEPTPLPVDLLQTLRGNDLTRTVFLDNPPSLMESCTEPELGSFPGPVFQEAAVVHEEPNRVIVEVTRQEPGYLVFLDVWYPGWKCYTATGKELPVWRADALFRAVLLPPGHHRLEFIFAPATYRAGRTISLATLGGLCCLVVWGLIRKVRGRWKKSANAFRSGGGRIAVPAHRAA